MSELGPNLRPLVLFGPSGSGKSTLLKKIMQDFPNVFGFSVSHTTRQPRPNEIDGVHYHFTTKEDMQKAIDNGEFIESATFGNNMYGTSKKAVKDVLYTGKICILDIEIQGVQQIKKTDFKPWYIFIEPPSIEELKKRLIGRNTETEESLKARLKIAETEIKYGKTPGNVDVVITNDDLDKAYLELKEFIKKNCLN